MDLTSFTNSKVKKQEKVIKYGNDISITSIDENLIFEIKSKEALRENSDLMFMAPSKGAVFENEVESLKFFEDSINDNVEGIMGKSLDSIYKPGLRTGAMTKLKETKEDIDVVILAAEHGKGKRAGYYSSFLVAVKSDIEDDSFLIVGKVSSGIKELEDSELGVSMQKLKSLLDPLKIKEDRDFVYFKPKVVIQVRYQEIQKSTTYDSGFALRFPRIINLRDDKSIDEINSLNDLSYLA